VRCPAPAFGVLLSLVLFSLPAAAQANADLAKGKQLLAQQKYKDAAAVLRKANEQAGGQCAPCLVALAGAYNGMERYKEAIATARQVIEVPIPQPLPPSLLALAYNEYGAGLAKDDPERNLEKAEALLLTAIKLGGAAVNVAHYNLAEVYRRQGRHADAVSLARKYLANEPQGFVAVPARAVICRSAVEGALPRTPADLSVLPKPGPGKAVAANGAQVALPRRLYATGLNLEDELYWARVRGSKLRAIIDLAVATDEDGCVREVQVVKGPGNDIEKALVHAVRNSLFEPPLLDGRPVAAAQRLELRFNVR